MAHTDQASLAAAVATLDAAIARAFAGGHTGTLRAVDRCDRCGAQAYVRAQTATGLELLFCAHHFHASELALINQGATVTVNECHLLTPQAYTYQTLPEEARATIRSAFRAGRGEFRAEPEPTRGAVTLMTYTLAGFGLGAVSPCYSCGPGLTGAVSLHGQVCGQDLHPVGPGAPAGTAVLPEFPALLEQHGARITIGMTSINRVVVAWADELGADIPADDTRRLVRSQYEYALGTFVKALISDLEAGVGQVWASYNSNEYVDNKMVYYIAQLG